MTALPFITAPAAPTTRDVGTAAAGILRFPVLGGVTVGESVVLNELLVDKPNAFVAAARIADSIAKEEKVTLLEAFTVIEHSVSGIALEAAADEIRLRHAARIDEVIKVFSASNDYTKEAAVTALVRCRLDLPSWGITDTRKMLQPLFDGIYALYQEELSAEGTESAPVTEEELGKPQPVSGGPSKPTGRKSRTTSSTPSPANTTD